MMETYSKPKRPGRIKDISGERFGRLVVECLLGTRNGQSVWRCRCDCGGTTDQVLSALRHWDVRSCGCVLKGRRNTDVIAAVRRKTVVTESGCWETRAKLHGKPHYATMSVLGRYVSAHRAVYEAVHGPIPSGMDVCHRCDNPPCCNPDHLFLGTRKDNVADCIRKGRAVLGGRRISPDGRAVAPEVVSQ